MANIPAYLLLTVVFFVCSTFCMFFYIVYSTSRKQEIIFTCKTTKSEVSFSNNLMTHSKIIKFFFIFTWITGIYSFLRISDHPWKLTESLIKQETRRSLWCFTFHFFINKGFVTTLSPIDVRISFSFFQKRMSLRKMIDGQKYTWNKVNWCKK